jgi:hypothetical protein
MTALLNREKFHYDKTGVFLTPARHSPETAVGVHGFSVLFSWQFHFDKNTGAAVDRCILTSLGCGQSTTQALSFFLSKNSQAVL